MKGAWKCEATLYIDDFMQSTNNTHFLHIQQATYMYVLKTHHTTYTPHTHHMHTTYTPHTHHIHTTYTPHAHTTRVHTHTLSFDDNTFQAVQTTMREDIMVEEIGGKICTCDCMTIHSHVFRRGRSQMDVVRVESDGCGEGRVRWVW